MEWTDVTLDPTQRTDVYSQLINDTEPTSLISYQKFQLSPKNIFLSEILTRLKIKFVI